MTPTQIILSEILDWMPTALFVGVIIWFAWLWRARG